MDSNTDDTAKSTSSVDELSSALHGLRSAFKDLNSGLAQRSSLSVKEQDDLASYLKRQATRFATSYFGGACSVCNNLRPRDHENSSTFNRTIFNRWHEDESMTEQLEEKSVGLFLDEIKFGDLNKKRIRPDGETASHDGCSYCTLLCEILDAFYPEWLRPVPYDGLSRYASLHIRENMPLIFSATNLVTSPDWAHNRTDIELYFTPPRTDALSRGATQEAKLSSTGEGVTTEVTGLQQTSNEDSAWRDSMPMLGPALPKFSSAGSTECLALAVDCFQECISEHSLCSSVANGGTSFTPSRLLYLGSSERDLRLWESSKIASEKHHVPKWAALSHCWGQADILKLTASSITSMRVSINHSDLPATFRDAIRVCRLLKIEYIWIDSLCIIQDSRADWEYEAKMMGSVYGRSMLVISAASSPSPDVSFLSQRDDDWQPKAFQFTANNGTAHDILARRRHVLASDLVQGLKEPRYTSSWATLPRTGPLQKRAWVFQESFLAARNLQFTPGGLVWECRLHRRSEGHLPPYPDLREDTLGTISTDRKWHMIVKAYTSRKLTFPTDRLPAISGIAAEIASEKHRDLVRMGQSSSDSGPEYLAGLWRSSIYIDLLWCIMPGADHYPLTFDRNVAVAPTWSWASIDRGVLWNSGYRNFKVISEITNIDIQLRKAAGEGAVQNPFGEISTGALTIRGRILRCRIFYNSYTKEHFIHLRRPDGSRTRGVWFRADSLLRPIRHPATAWPKGVSPLPDSTPAAASVPTTSEPKDEIKWYIRRGQTGDEDHKHPIYKQEAEAWLLFIAHTTPFTSFGYLGLVLGLSPQYRRYERMGCVENVSEEWYEEAEMAEVIVV